MADLMLEKAVKIAEHATVDVRVFTVHVSRTLDV